MAKVKLNLTHFATNQLDVSPSMEAEKVVVREIMTTKES